MSDHGKHVSKVAAMIAGGAVVGAGFGLLFAPKTGAETRREITRYAKKAQYQAIRAGRSVQSGVKDFMQAEQDTTRKNNEEQMVLAAAVN